MLNTKIEFSPSSEKISFKRIILTLIGSVFAYGLLDKSITRALAEYGLSVKASGGQLFQYTNWYILTVVLGGTAAGFLTGAIIRKRGKLYGAFPCLTWMIVLLGYLMYYLYMAGYSLSSLVEEWRNAGAGWDWYLFSHGMLAMFAYGAIAGSIGGHYGEKIAKRYQAKGRNEENSLFLFFFAPKARTILTTLFLADLVWYSILSLGIEMTILKWWIIGICFILGHFFSLFYAGALLGITTAFSFSILLIPFMAPFLFHRWWNYQKTKLRKAGLYTLFLFGLPIAVIIGSFLTDWGVRYVVDTAGQQGIHVWGILLDTQTRPDYYFRLSQFYKDNGKDDKAKENLKMSNDELVRYARAKLQVERPSEAVGMLERIIEQDTGHIVARLMLGDIYLEQFGDTERAISYFEKGSQMTPRDSADEIALVETLTKIGEIYLEQVADTQKALVYFEKALQISPEDPFAALQVFDINRRLGIHYMDDLRDNQTAIKYLIGALEIFPEDPEVLYYIGLAYKEEDIIKSRQFLQEAIKYGSVDSTYDYIVQNAKDILLEYSK
jgi:hypothetical protein